MKQVKLNIIKKNRIWIECTDSKGYKCKLKVSDQTKDLNIGTHELLVSDISIRSSYGIDIRYEVLSNNNEKIFLKSDIYNCILVDRCKKLGGIWDANEKTWVFSSFLQDEIDNLEFEFCSEMVNVEIKAKRDICECQDSVYFMGYRIAIAKGRDSDAFLGKDVYQIFGKISSGGSVKNWVTKISEGSVFRLKVCKTLLENYESERFEYKILES